MSRVIKFRAWDATSGRYYAPLHEAYAGRLFELMVGFSGDLLAHTMNGIEHQSTFTNQYVLEQFTGLHDANGKEIYEGDIVEFTYWWFDGNHVESQLKGEIVYLPDCMSFGMKGVKNNEWCHHVGCDEESGDTAAFANWLFDEADFHVIGNIHETPELMI